MRRIIIKLNVFFKGVLLLIKPHIIFGWARRPMFLFSNLIGLSKWMSMQSKDGVINDFYTAKRDHSKRYDLYEHLLKKINIKDESIDYLEFGVCGANSFRWWLKNLQNPESRFYGFDTFEGLPENWGVYDKGDMSASIPVVNDERAEFIKGLFQDTMRGFLNSHDLNNGKRKLVHLDADLFSSTLFVLTSLAPYLRKGDILLFDEFNVPNHEYLAFKMFADSYYIKTKLIGAVNNFYQVALLIE